MLTNTYGSVSPLPDGDLLVEDGKELLFVEPAAGRVIKKIALNSHYHLHTPTGATGLLNVQGELFKVENRELVYLAGKKEDRYSTVFPVGSEGYVITSRRSARRIDNSGETLWQFKSPRLLPVSYDLAHKVLFAGEGRYLLAIDDRSGKVLWHTPSEWASWPAAEGGLALRGPRARLLGSGGRELWSYDAGEKIRSAAAWEGGIWLICRNSIHAIDNNGKRLCVVRGEEHFKSVLSDGTLVITNESRDARYNAAGGAGQAGEEITLTAIAPNGRRLWRWRSDVLYWNIAGSAERAYLVSEKALLAIAAPR